MWNVAYERVLEPFSCRFGWVSRSTDYTNSRVEIMAANMFPDPHFAFHILQSAFRIPISSPVVDWLKPGPTPTLRVSKAQPHQANLFDHLYSRRPFQRPYDPV